ncbi:MAG: phosphatase PAP2 family protein [Rubrivivax sp.]|nr:phosphatase PAP2 family protein [Rubrivivax sp.]
MSSTWRVRLWSRFRRYFLVKAVGITAFVGLFFIAYFELLRHPARAVTQMPLIWLDQVLPFEPAALWIYLSLWFYVGIAPGLLFSLRALLMYGVWAIVLCSLGLGTFYFWPTAVPPQTMDLAQFPAFAVLRGVDAAGNACPSMHVATAMFTAIRLGHVLRMTRVPAWLHAANALWFVAIAYSTMAVRQHVALDVLAGVALGAAVAMASLRWPGTNWPVPPSLERAFRRWR